jgi:hypothetical protein
MGADNLATLPGFKETDDGDYENTTHGIHIEPVENGWIVNVSNDEADYRKVFEYKNGAQMMKFLAETLGIEK